MFFENKEIQIHVCLLKHRLQTKITPFKNLCYFLKP